MTVTLAVKPRAILSTEEVARLIALVETTAKPSFEYVAAVTELPAELLRKLVRDGVLDGAAPYRVTGVIGWCDLDQARRIANQLATARRPVDGVGILATVAAIKYGFSHSAIYKWRDDGWVKEVGRDKLGDQLLNEGDIAVARALADLVGHTQGKPVFPQRRKKAT